MICESQTRGPTLVMALPSYITTNENGFTLAVKVQPRASRDEIVGGDGAELKIKVTAPPVDSAANDAVIRLLAEALDCPRNALAIIRGKSSRHKVIAVNGSGTTLADALKKISK